MSLTPGRLEQSAFVELHRTHGRLSDALGACLRAEGLSEPQFNVLRILRGAGAEGLPCQEIARRMIARHPDVTRLLDRLVESGLALRHRSESDRRVVVVKATKRALTVLGKLDRPIAALHVRQLGHLSRAELTRLIALLRKARGATRGERGDDEDSTGR